MRFSAPVAALTLALGALGAAPAPARVKRQVPRGFLGVTADGPLDDPAINLDRELALMATSGVESVRASFYWDLAQPYAKSSDVPADQRARFREVDGVPTDFAPSDRIVLAAARQRLPVLPVVLRAPVWARKHPERVWSPPSRPSDYARYLRALIGRYGPRGSLWTENPGVRKLPIHDWQIWNEPNGAYFWNDRPPYGGVPNAAYRGPYIALLRAAHDAIKAADPAGRTILAGFFGKSWYVLGFLYDFDRRVRRYFDAAALHPFTAKPENVKAILTLTRNVMNARGDRRKPMLVTEMSWPSAAGRRNQSFGFEVSEREQAKRLERGYALLVGARRQLRLERIYWYNWASYDVSSITFAYAGLRRFAAGSFVSKPAFFSFRKTALRLEGCPGGKSSVSTC